MAWLQGSRKKGWRVVERVNGQCVPQTPIMHDHGDAMQKLAAFQEKKATRREVASAGHCGTTIAAALLKWKAWGVKEKVFRPVYGDESERSILRIADKMKWKAIKDITKEDVKTWRDETPRNTTQPLRVLKSFLTWLRDEEFVPIDDGVLGVGRVKKERKKVDNTPLLTHDEADAAMKLAYEHGGFGIGMAVEHQLRYPCRPIDVARCRVKHWNAAEQLITYEDTKNGDTQVKWVSAEHAEKLSRLAAGRGPEDFLFVDQKRKPLYDAKRDRAGPLCKWYHTHVGSALFTGKQRGIYRLKRYAITHYNRAARGDRRAVMSVSGHRTAAMIDLYSDTNHDEQRALIERYEASIPFLASGSNCGSKSGSNHLAAAFSYAQPETVTPCETSAVLTYTQLLSPR